MSICPKTTPLFSIRKLSIHSQPLIPTGENPRQRSCDITDLLGKTETKTITYIKLIKKNIKILETKIIYWSKKWILRRKKEKKMSDTNPDDPCSGKLSALFTRVAKHVFGFFLMVVLCNVTHYLLRPLSQPRITSDTFVSLSLYFYQEFYNSIILSHSLCKIEFRFKSLNPDNMNNTKKLLCMFLV